MIKEVIVLKIKINSKYILNRIILIKISQKIFKKKKMTKYHADKIKIQSKNL